MNFRWIRLCYCSGTVPLLLFQVTAFFIPWLIVVWLSNYKGIDALADFSVILALISPLCLFLASPSRNFTLSKEGLSKQTILKLRLLLSCFGFVSVLVAAILMETTFSLLLLSLSLFLSKTSEFYYDLPIADLLKKKAHLTLVLRSIRKLFFSILGLSVMFLSGSLELGLIMLSVLFLLDALAQYSSVRPTHKPKIDALPGDASKFKMFYLLSSALPLTLSALVFSIYFYLPRYILGVNNMGEELAIFTVSSFPVMLLIVATNAIYQSHLPVWRECISAQNLRKLYKSLLRVLLLSAFLCLFLQLFNITFFAHAYWVLHNNIQAANESLLTIYHLVILFSFGSVFFSLSNYLLVVAHEHRFLLVITVVNTLSTFVIAWYAFDVWAITGLVVTMAVSGMAQFIVSALRFNQKVKHT